MGMPDKIYLNKYMIRKGMMYPAQPPADVPEEEYIRKDALLEWLENKAKVHDSFVNGLTYLAYQDVIEHINEM